MKVLQFKFEEMQYFINCFQTSRPKIIMIYDTAISKVIGFKIGLL